MKASLLLIFAAPLAAQDPLSLKDAVERALAHHPSVVAARHGVKAAEMGVAESRSGYLPKLNYAESWQRSNNPVFVFSSLLTQHQFEAANFQLGPLNRP